MVHPVLVLRLFNPFSNLHQFLIWALSFSIYALFTDAHFFSETQLGRKTRERVV